MAAVRGLASQVAGGANLRLMCGCYPSACHGDAIKAYIDEHLLKAAASGHLWGCHECDSDSDDGDGCRGGDNIEQASTSAVVDVDVAEGGEAPDDCATVVSTEVALDEAQDAGASSGAAAFAGQAGGGRARTCLLYTSPSPRD